jgi:hypothetical protein
MRGLSCACKLSCDHHVTSHSIRLNRYLDVVTDEIGVQHCRITHHIPLYCVLFPGYALQEKYVHCREACRDTQISMAS